MHIRPDRAIFCHYRDGQYPRVEILASTSSWKSDDICMLSSASNTLGTFHLLWKAGSISLQIFGVMG